MHNANAKSDSISKCYRVLFETDLKPVQNGTSGFCILESICIFTCVFAIMLSPSIFMWFRSISFWIWFLYEFFIFYFLAFFLHRLHLTVKQMLNAIVFVCIWFSLNSHGKMDDRFFLGSKVSKRERER